MSQDQFESLQTLLRQLHAPVELPELHGALTGYLSAGSGLNRNNWLRAIAQDEIADELQNSSDHAAFGNLYDDTRAAMNDEDLSFSPFLPDTEQPIDTRSEALVNWCRGYLGGLGLTGVDPASYLNDEAQDALNDLAKIAATTVSEVEPTNEAEEDFFELFEYVRISVIMIADDLRELREQATGKH